MHRTSYQNLPTVGNTQCTLTSFAIYTSILSLAFCSPNMRTATIDLKTLLDFSGIHMSRFFTEKLQKESKQFKRCDDQWSFSLILCLFDVLKYFPMGGRLMIKNMAKKCREFSLLKLWNVESWQCWLIPTFSVHLIWATVQVWNNWVSDVSWTQKHFKQRLSQGTRCYSFFYMNV